MMYRNFTLIGVALMLLGCFSSDPTNSNTNNGTVAATVDMTNELRFVSASVTIKAGQAVLWHNSTTFVHTVTSTNPQLFDSGDITSGGNYTHTFTSAGTYEYVCLPHASSGMRGTVIVQ